MLASSVSTSLGATAWAKSGFAPGLPVVKRKNGVPIAPPWHAVPSALVGLAVQVEEIGARCGLSTSRNADLSIPSSVSSVKTGAAGAPSKWPTKVRRLIPTSSCQEMYGTLPANVMSGRLELRCGLEMGWPPFRSTKWSPPASRATKTPCPRLVLPPPHTPHGTVGCRGVIVPAATRGFSASLPGMTFSEHASSAACDSAQGPEPLVPELSRTLAWPAVPRPTATHWNPPSAAAFATAFAANTISLLRSPGTALGSSSYQTVHTTVSSFPVKAMSGSTPARVGSMLSDGSFEFSGATWPESRRSCPTCWKQNPFRLFADDGLKPVHGVPAAGCFTPFDTKICRGESASVSPPSFSSHTIHGTGSLPATVAPPATEGFSAVRLVWMLRDGTRRSAVRSWPDGSHAFAPAWKRLAKMFVGSPKFLFGSYHATQGTVRPAPAKSIDGASATTR